MKKTLLLLVCSLALGPLAPSASANGAVAAASAVEEDRRETRTTPADDGPPPLGFQIGVCAILLVACVAGGISTRRSRATKTA